MSDESPAILVVEDDFLIRMAAVDLVGRAGYQVVEARDADEAISILEARTDIRLVFTDVDMPGSIDGLKLSHFIRNRWPPIHIIVASGKVILERSHLPAGARFFPKPYVDQKIVAALAEMLG